MPVPSLQAVMRRPLILALCAAAWPAPALAQSCDDRNADPAARIAVCDAAALAAPTTEEAALALSLKGEAQRLVGDYTGAAQTLARALGLTPTDAWIWVELGNVRYDEGDLPGALAHYSAALAVEDYLFAWANRADTWWQFDQGQRCSEDADNALRLDPAFAFANEVKGRCLMLLGRADQALAYFDSAIALVPDYQNAYRNKVAALTSLGRAEEAVAVADLALDPATVPNPDPGVEEDIRSLRLLAVAAIAPEAEITREIDALLTRYPQNLAAVNVRAVLLLRAGDLAQADAMSRPLRENPGGLRLPAAYHDTLARIDMGLGRLEDAVANFYAAMRVDANQARIYARHLSALGFLPLSNAPDAVLLALQRCIDVMQADCRMPL
jgi:predicted Zn-dependent protease